MCQSIPAVNIPPRADPRGILLRGRNLHPRAKRAVKLRPRGKNSRAKKQNKTEEIN